MPKMIKNVLKGHKKEIKPNHFVDSLLSESQHEKTCLMLYKMQTKTQTGLPRSGKK